jgi:pimeloyl-ACP methyl ester carboxylesterase
MDMFPITSLDYLRATVADPDATEEFPQLYGEASPQQIEDWEDARTECARLGWQPYMHNPSLPDLLPGLNGLQALVVWGDKDQILPADAARTYAERIPGARLKVIPGVGHRPEVEARDAFVAELSSFLN